MKKFRLLASISSLCFAIAVLCFGVFAANSVTYTISGSISYTVSDVFCNIDVAVYSSGEVSSDTLLKTYADAIAAKGAATSTQENVTVGSSTATFTYIKNGSYTNSTGSVSGIISGSGGTLTTTASALNLSYTSSAYSYFIVIKITNLASRALKVSGTTTWGASVNSYKYVSATNSTGIAQNASGNFVIAMSLTDKKVGISSANTFSLPITLAY